MEEDGKILFCGSDVAKALAYANPSKAIRDHGKGITKRSILTKKGMQVLLFIPEPDVYRLAMRSKLPAAGRFEIWVVETILPDIRRHGAYITPELMAKLEGSPELSSQLAKILKEGEGKLVRIEKQIELMAAKSDYFDKLVAADTLTNIRQTAKDLHIPEKLFTYLLVEMGIVYRTKNYMLMPYAYMVTCGFAELKECVNGNHGGVYLLFTPVGRLYL